jgi:hypothetical protein
LGISGLGAQIALAGNLAPAPDENLTGINASGGEARQVSVRSSRQV